MKYFIILAVSLFFIPAVSYAQLDDLLNKVKNKVEDKANQETDEAIDKTVDDAVDDVKNGNKKEEQQQDEEVTEEQNNENTEVNENKTSDTKTKEVKLETYSKYDFIPGEQVIFYEDFSQDNVGDFPAKWNTNASGEVVTMNKYPGKWFAPSLNGVTYPEFNAVLPENYTIEFDVVFAVQETGNFPPLLLSVYEAEDEPMDALVPGKGGFQFTFNHYDIATFNWKDQQYGTIDNHILTNHLEKNFGKIVRVSIWVQKQRARVYLDENKIVDIPRLVYPDLKMNRIRLYEGTDVEGKFYISNFRVAVGAPDMRSKLITEGKLVTRGILFDSGSDKIKPESYGTLKEIANVLKENSGVKVQIVGHTDADGNDASNLDLSKRRALSVKTSLVSDFGIEESRMTTDGKGESVPVADNNTSEGKANNRRVEFIKK
ncbi:MAG TPA: OmpA family protein [Ignavibacteriaceae bacterium]|nr:OmpA family protein [Ignavibacteriaceae bacterium]